MKELETLQNLIANYGLKSRSCAIHPNSDMFWQEQKKAALEIEKQFVYIIQERDGAHNQVIRLEHLNKSLQEQNDKLIKSLEFLRGLMQEIQTNGN
jgi:hypothetical protein